MYMYKVWNWMNDKSRRVFDSKVFFCRIWGFFHLSCNFQTIFETLNSYCILYAIIQFCLNHSFTRNAFRTVKLTSNFRYLQCKCSIIVQGVESILTIFNIP